MLSGKRQKREAFRASQSSRDADIKLPKKKLYRQRAHANPFSDHALTYPACPSLMDWSVHYPAFIDHAHEKEEGKPVPLTRNVTIADIGCGYGGLIVALSTLVPDELMIGLEIRTQVTTYVNDRIRALRHQNLASRDADPASEDGPPSPSSPYQNISALRANTMKFLPNFFPRASLKHIFLCFPDPHFKARKHKARIVSETLCAEYAYVLRPGGMVWTITDVEDLAQWMETHFRLFGASPVMDQGVEGGPPSHGLFERVEVPDEGKENEIDDECMGHFLRCMRSETEEGKKVSRNGGRKFVSVWRRKDDPPWPE